MGVGVGGQVDLSVDPHGDSGGPAAGSESDLGDPADGHVVDLDGGLRGEAEDIAELGGDLVRVVPEVGTAGERHLVDAPERRQADGRGDEHEADAGGDQRAEGRDHPGAGSGRGGAHGVASFFFSSGPAFFVPAFSGVP